MAFITVEIAPGISKTQHRKAAIRGPRAVVSTGPADQLMSAARFSEVAVNDVTDDFLRTARAWFRGFDEHKDDLEQVLGAQEWAERQGDRKSMIEAIEEGLLRRLIVTGTNRP
jgi:hypothetical protein